MTRVLVSLDADLASSIALRYACQLAGLAGMELQPIHVEEAGSKGSPPGSGWVRRTWEAALLEAGRDEIVRLIDAERDCCHGALLPPKLCMGHREEEILRELTGGNYDLFVEGALYRFTAADFSAKLRSRLYRYSPCPIVLVRNLVEIEKVALLLSDGVAYRPLVEHYCRLLGEVPLSLDLFYYQPRHPLFGQDALHEPRPVLEAAARDLAKESVKLGRQEVLADSPERAAETLRDYGLVLAGISRQHRKGAVAKLLGLSPAPCLLVILH